LSFLGESDSRRALAAFKGANPDAEIDAIKVDIPNAPPPPLPAAVPVPYNGAYSMNNNNAFRTRLLKVLHVKAGKFSAE